MIKTNADFNPLKGLKLLKERVMSKLLFFFVAYLPELAADPNRKKHVPSINF